MLRYGIVVSPARGSEEEEGQDPGAEERKGGERAHLQRTGAHRPEALPIVRKLLVRVAPGKVQEMSSTQVREREERPRPFWGRRGGREGGW